MRAYLALAVLTDCVARGCSGRPTHQKARSGGDRRSRAALHLGTTRLRAMAGAQTIAGQTGVVRSRLRFIHSIFLKNLQHFQGGLMTSFVAATTHLLRAGRYLWRIVGARTSGTPRARSSGTMRPHADSGIFTAFGGVRIPVGPPNLQLYGTAGVRYFYSRTALDLSFPVSGFHPQASPLRRIGQIQWPSRGHYAINDKYSSTSWRYGRPEQQRDRSGPRLGWLQCGRARSHDARYRVLYTYFRTRVERSMTYRISRGCRAVCRAKYSF